MLRSYRINFRKSWVLKPSDWNMLFGNLARDINDLSSEIAAMNFDIEGAATAIDDVVEVARQDTRVEYPNI